MKEDVFHLRTSPFKDATPERQVFRVLFFLKKEIFL